MSSRPTYLTGAQPTREKMVGCSLVADLVPAYEDGSGDMLSSLADLMQQLSDFSTHFYCQLC